MYGGGGSTTGLHNVDIIIRVYDESYESKKNM